MWLNKHVSESESFGLLGVNIVGIRRSYETHSEVEADHVRENLYPRLFYYPKNHSTV